MMISVDLARGAVIAVLPCLALAGELRVEYIYAVAFVQSTLGILFDCGEFAAIPSLVDTDELVTANGRIMATNSAGQVLGPVVAGALVTLMPVANMLFFDAASFVVSALSLVIIRRSFNSHREVLEGGVGTPSTGRRLIRDVREGLIYVWSHPVLRSISIMMALINFVSVTAYTQLVLFAKQTMSVSDTQVAVLYAAGSAGVVIISLSAGSIRRHLSFALTALGALVVSGLAVTAMAIIQWYPAALILWAAASGFGLLLNINTGALRQAIVPSHMFGRVISIAGVLAWSAIPIGALAGAAVIKASGNVASVYIGEGLLTAAIAVVFGFSPVRDGDRYLEATKLDAPAKS
jgi:Na+/melibiose symporter-like transporter